MRKKCITIGLAGFVFSSVSFATFLFLLTTASVASAVTLLEPANDSTTYMIHPQFRWTVDSSADRYEIQIANDSSFSSIQQSDSIPVPRYVPLQYMPVNGDYWWRVRVQYADGSVGTWSSASRLSIASGTVYRVYPTNTLAEIKAVIADAAANTPSRLIFDPGTYELDLSDGDSLFYLNRKQDMYIYGVNCNIIMQNPDSRFSVFVYCKDIHMRGFSVEYATEDDGIPVTHTAGSVVSVNENDASFVFDPFDGYLPPTDPCISNASQRTWGYLVNSNVPGRLKYNVPDFYSMSDTVSDLGNGQYRLYLSEDHASRISYFDAGDVFVKNAGWGGRQILTAVGSTNISYFLIKNYASPGAFFGGNYNDGIHFLMCKSLLKTGRYVSTAADGFIGAGYKTGFWMEECEVEGLLDDCINASSTHLHVESQVSTNILKVYSASLLEAGNHLTLFNPPDAAVEGEYTVLSSVKGVDGLWTVTLDGAVQTVYPGQDNWDSQLFIKERSHQYAYIRNNTFENSRRYGALFRAHNAVIEGNTFAGLGSAAIHGENDSILSFDGGLDNSNVRILDNSIDDCGQGYYFFTQEHGAIELGINGYYSTCTQMVHQLIEISGNEIYDWDGKGIRVENTRDVLIYSNTVSDLNAASFASGVSANYAVYLSYVSNAVVTENILLDDRFMDSAIYISDSSDCIVLDNQMDSTCLFADDFSGSAGDVVQNSTPEVSPGLAETAYKVALDGLGHVVATSVVHNAGYRVQLDGDPLTNDSGVTAIQVKAVFKAPSSDWVGIGFSEGDAAGLLTSGANSGPWVVFSPSGAVVHGGHGTTGSVNSFPGLYSAGDVVSAEFTYHVLAQKADLYVDGEPVVLGLPITHKNESGIEEAPSIEFVQLQLRNQTSGGAYIDSMSVDILPVEVH